MTVAQANQTQVSVLAQLLEDERSRLISKDWLLKWFGADVANKWHSSAQEAERIQKILSSFRRTLRNFVDNRPLADGASWKSAESADEPFGEEIMRCYVTILCRQVALEPRWLAGFQAFSGDEIVLLKPARDEMREGLRGWDDCREMALNAVAGFYGNLTSARDAASPWPHLHELPLTTVIPPNTKINFRKKKYFPQLNCVQEYLFPALSAFRHFNHGPEYHRDLLCQYVQAKNESNEFHRLIGEEWRLKDGARQLMFRLFAMVVERMLSLARSPTLALSSGNRHAVELDDIGRCMDDEIREGRIGLSKPSGQLDSRVDESLKSATLASSSASDTSVDLRMPALPSGLELALYGQISATAAFDSGDESIFVLRIAEAELPESVGWYELELAWADDNQARPALSHCALIAIDPEPLVEAGWASFRYRWPSNLGATRLRELPVQAGYRILSDGAGALVLAVIPLSTCRN